MRKSLYLYIIIVVVLMNVFTYAWYNKQLQFEREQHEKYAAKMKDSVLINYNNMIDANYFSLLHNDNAKSYLENYDTAQLVPKITDQLMDLNDNPNGNSILPYGILNEKKFVINKVLVLNHRWIIADFSDGQMWGEVLIKYFIEKDDSITFERIDSLLYQNKPIEEK